eukprot:GDKI01043891.1.p1 GENE.GDKI01043891.1~~GDKI01043891.1.p1  ORF type:complete len:143 (+),score=22.88 GDKI01043891.1:124-552(+)
MAAANTTNFEAANTTNTPDFEAARHAASDASDATLGLQQTAEQTVEQTAENSVSIVKFTPAFADKSIVVSENGTVVTSTDRVMGYAWACSEDVCVFPSSWSFTLTTPLPTPHWSLRIGLMPASCTWDWSGLGIWICVLLRRV